METWSHFFIFHFKALGLLYKSVALGMIRFWVSNWRNRWSESGRTGTCFYLRSIMCQVLLRYFMLILTRTLRSRYYYPTYKSLAHSYVTCLRVIGKVFIFFTLGLRVFKLPCSFYLGQNPGGNRWHVQMGHLKGINKGYIYKGVGTDERNPQRRDGALGVAWVPGCVPGGVEEGSGLQRVGVIWLELRVQTEGRTKSQPMVTQREGEGGRKYPSSQFFRPLLPC